MAQMFIEKLAHGASLTVSDKDVLSNLVSPPRHVPAHTELWAEVDKPHALPLLLDGWACRYRILETGARQILSILLPGDLCEPFGTLPDFVDYSVATLTAAEVALVQPAALRQASQDNKTLEKALWWDLLMVISIEREHMVSLGRRSASERLAHLLCELHLRLELVGRVDDLTFTLPMIQADLADTLGLSTVHLNRSLQDLRGLGLITFKEKRLTIHDLEGIRQLATFDPSYLHAQTPDRTVGTAS